MREFEAGEEAEGAGRRGSSCEGVDVGEASRVEETGEGAESIRGSTRSVRAGPD